MLTGGVMLALAANLLRLDTVPSKDNDGMLSMIILGVLAEV